ncbi:hypothetical protein [Kitasatospora sp. NPDC058046]|uniref:hypothetical protein n=1 Tax=Kitasatospora sp. NPDC058046 TaxID=3346312 RepID=UPI0036D9DED7
MDAAEFVYDIDFVIAEPDDQPAPERKTLRVRVVDSHPQPRSGPAIAIIHRALRDALREADPEAYARIGAPDDLVILKLRDAASA